MNRFVVLLALGAGNAVLQAQAVKPGVEEMRRDLEAATAAVTIESAGMSPFHVEASFSTFDFEGKPDGTGTLVEDWLNVDTKRRTITFRGATWTQVAHGGSLQNSGTGFEGSFMEEAVVHALLAPGPTAAQIAGGKPGYKPLKVGDVALDCTLLTPINLSKKANIADQAPTGYCVSQKPLLLRVVQQRYGVLTTYNQFARLAGHYLPEQVNVTTGARIRATLQVTSFKTAPLLKETDFVVKPASDTSASNPLVDSGMLSGAIVSRITPHYPEEDKLTHTSGSVYLHAIIDASGVVSGLEVISTPSPTLAKAALAAVRQWKYKPYLVNGVPTAVDTTVTVNFAFA